MAFDNKPVSKQAKQENKVFLIVRIVCGLILGVFIWNGWIVKPSGTNDPFVTENLWEAVHPASALNVIGLVLMILSILSLTGFTKWIWGMWSMPIGSSWIPQALAFGGILGALLTFA